MSDAELSDVGDDDIIREHERQDGDEENFAMDQENDQDVRNVSGDEVMMGAYEEGAADNAETPSVPTKKKTTRKLVVLNTERLKGSKGVHTIEKLFKDFKFKGKGHEKEDLDRVMKNLEYWAYRLFPKLDFDDFLAKCEHLGHKKDLQTHLKKYRTDIINADSYANDIIIGHDSSDDEVMQTENNINGNDGNENLNDSILGNFADNSEQISNSAFQRLFDETHQNNKKTTETTQSIPMIDQNVESSMNKTPGNNVQVLHQYESNQKNNPIELVDENEFEKLIDATGTAQHHKCTQNNTEKTLQQSKSLQQNNQVQFIDDDAFESLMTETEQVQLNMVQTQPINKLTKKNSEIKNQVIDDDEFDALMADFV